MLRRSLAFFASVSFMFLAAFVSPSFSSVFVPDCPLADYSDILHHKDAYMLTVLHGYDISRIPVKILSVIPQTPSANFRDLILIQLIGAKLAQGMSGSPVYVDGKLLGAVRSGWTHTDHTLALVMPITAMSRLSEYDAHGLRMSDVFLTGLTNTSKAIDELSRKLGVRIMPGISVMRNSEVTSQRLKPGSSISVLLVWGDAELSASGTVTAVDRHGRFLAFGHEFLKRGTVQYPSASAYVHKIIDSAEFPMKLTSVGAMNGTVTQDRETGISGKFGYYGSSIGCEFVMRDLDLETEHTYKFRTITDENLTADLIEGIVKGLAEDAWGRKGQGTMSIKLRIDGEKVPQGWTRKDIFYSDTNITDEAFKQTKQILSAYLSQPFSEIMPTGFHITAEVTQTPKVLLIEDVEAPTDAKPGESLDVTVKLRSYRKKPITRKFTLKVPEDASGVIELIVRGGGTQSFQQAGISGGWKSITSLENMLTEFQAADGNNQLIIELNADRSGELIKRITQSRKKGAKSPKPKREPDLLPEEEEYLSETKARRIREGTLKILTSEYYIDGLMRRVIHTERE